MSKRSETLKKRYQVYRRLGYNSKTARALSHRALDVSQLEISEKTGKLKQNSTTKQYFEKDMREWKNRQAVDKYIDRVSDIDNDTTLTRYGMITHDKRYKGENGRIISIIKNENGLSRDQAYYFFYVMTQSGMTYEQTKKQLLTNKEFEEYDKRKQQRRQRSRSNKRRMSNQNRKR